MFKAGVGFSKSHNPKRAGREAAEAAIAALGDNSPDFVLTFATVGYEQDQLLSAIAEIVTDTPICGCSGEGVIAGAKTDESNFAVGVLAVASDEVRFHSGFVPKINSDPQRAGIKLGLELKDLGWDDLLGVLVLADGVHINLDRIVTSLKENLEKDVPFIGGAAGDNWKLTKTYQYANGKAFTDGMTWVAIGGKAQLDWTLSHGCVPIGGVRTVTRAKGNELYEIDGQPVLDVLSEYLSLADTWDNPIGNISFGFEAPSEFEDCDDPYKFLITHVAPTSEDAKRGCVVIPREVVEGTKIWIMRRDHDKISSGNKRMADKLRARHSCQPALVIHIDCASRGRACFGEQKKVELLHDLRAAIGETTPWIGFYSYGEFCPVGALNCGHCYTAVLATLHV